VILLDAFALIALLVDEPAAEPVERLLRDETVGVTGVNLAEAVHQLLQRRDVDVRSVHELVNGLLAGVELVELTAEDAWAAGLLRGRYHRALSIADCLLLATASHGYTIASSHPPLLTAARDERIDVMPLPDSRGRRTA
jgi:PIN domain nuclease of toxin-antitoxin system